MDGPTPDNLDRAMASGQFKDVCQWCVGVHDRLPIQFLASPSPVSQSSVCNQACVGNDQLAIEIVVGIVGQV